tara:strand:+ start:5588 stop:5776 length:189 start_codon:yes stop_codon:yes gene_type:complete
MLKFKHFLILVVVFCSSFLAAQPAPPDSENRAPLPGIVILAAAGAAYGARKSFQKRRENYEE